MSVHPFAPRGAPGTHAYEDDTLRTRLGVCTVVHAARPATQEAARRLAARGEARVITYAQARLLGYAEAELPGVLLVTRGRG